jgi:hypothetical protein
MLIFLTGSTFLKYYKKIIIVARHGGYACNPSYLEAEIRRIAVQG